MDKIAFEHDHRLQTERSEMNKEIRHLMDMTRTLRAQMTREAEQSREDLRAKEREHRLQIEELQDTIAALREQLDQEKTNA